MFENIQIAISNGTWYTIFTWKCCDLYFISSKHFRSAFCYIVLSYMSLPYYIDLLNRERERKEKTKQEITWVDLFLVVIHAPFRFFIYFSFMFFSPALSKEGTALDHPTVQALFISFILFHHFVYVNLLFFFFSFPFFE